jgi:aspartyl/asparaginyl-tRNA synthetase
MKNTKIEDVHLYHELVQKMRTFFLNKGFIEIPDGIRIAILAACENPHSIMSYEITNEDGKLVTYPLQQTNQMVLEEVILENPDINGIFCITTSYRDEKNPIPSRHKKVFKMTEFEMRGDINDLIKFEFELLEYLGFDKPVEVKYDDVCLEYDGVEILEDEHENRMWKEKGNVVFLQNFPLRTNPFWNMKSNDDGTFRKVDVILYGQETFGSAERSCNVNEMRNMFYSIEDGKYSNKLFELFGRERVESELEDFLKHNFVSRVGCGIGMSRLLRAYKLLKGL